MDQKTNSKIVAIVITIVVILLVVVLIAMPKKSQTNNTLPAQSDQTAAITSSVGAFGRQMKQVSLLAPSDALNASMESAYGEFATADAVAKWENDPSTAPGRFTSSPWPDHIDITNITLTSDTSASVQGNVVELTSNEVEHGGSADQYPVAITLVRQNGTWLVSDFQKTTSAQ